MRNAPYQASNAAELEELARKGIIQAEQGAIMRRRPCLTDLGEKFYGRVVAPLGLA